MSVPANKGEEAITLSYICLAASTKLTLEVSSEFSFEIDCQFSAKASGIIKFIWDR